MATLRKEVKSLREEVRKLAPQVIVLRSLTREQAKQEILAYFDAHPDRTIEYDELVRELGIELPAVVSICSELAQEGQIG